MRALSLIAVDEPPRSLLHRAVTGSLVLLCGAAASVGTAPSAPADEPPFHVLSSQDLCNLTWPASQAMPDPAQPVGTICVRMGGVLERFANAAPNLFSNKMVLEPGKAVALPVGSVRINTDNPMSDWLIPECHVPNRIDCAP